MNLNDTKSAVRAIANQTLAVLPGVLPSLSGDNKLLAEATIRKAQELHDAAEDTPQQPQAPTAPTTKPAPVTKKVKIPAGMMF